MQTRNELHPTWHTALILRPAMGAVIEEADEGRRVQKDASRSASKRDKAVQCISLIDCYHMILTSTGNANLRFLLSDRNNSFSKREKNGCRNQAEERIENVPMYTSTQSSIPRPHNTLGVGTDHLAVRVNE